MTQDELLEHINEMNPKALVPTGMEEAVIGYVERFGQEPLVLLDKKKCIKMLMKDMSEEEAEEYFSFNVIGAWMGEGTPCFATLKKDVEL